MKYSEVAFNTVMHYTILPLAKKWEEQLQQLEVLFDENKVTITIEHYELNSDTIHKFLEDSMPTIFFCLGEATDRKLVEIAVEYTGLKQYSRQKTILAGELFFYFNEDSYDIGYTGSDKKINKGYHQHLTKEEITAIADHLGNWFYNQVKQAKAE